MIAGSSTIQKFPLLRLLQVAAIVFSVVVVVFFLRHSLVTSAESFSRSFERLNAIELGSGETFLLARKLASVAKDPQFSCIQAFKDGAVFFEERRDECGAGPFVAKTSLKEDNQKIEITFYLRLQQDVFWGFLVFLFVQFILVLLTIFMQRQSIFLAHKKDLELAALTQQVGHDIRSPLAVLSSMNAEQTPPALKRSIERLKQLVAHLLGDVKVEQGIELGILVAQAVEEKILEKPGKIRFSTDLGSLEKVFLPGDPFLWRRMLSNLFNNSVEASAEGGAEISIRAQKEDDGIFLEIRDRGKGIPKEILAKLGKRGFSFAKSGGSGLGLYSSRSFLRSLGGELGIESEQGAGTTIKLWVPTYVAVLIEDDLDSGSLETSCQEKRHHLFPFFFAGRFSQW